MQTAICYFVGAFLGDISALSQSLEVDEIEVSNEIYNAGSWLWRSCTGIITEWESLPSPKSQLRGSIKILTLIIAIVIQFPLFQLY